MLKKDKKEYVYSRLDGLLKPQGYKFYKAGLDPRYNLNTEDYVVSLIFNFKDMGDVYLGNVILSIKVVEDIMYEIKKPNQNYEHVDFKKYYLYTLIDKSFMKDEKRDENIDDINKLRELVDNYINYLETTGKEFIETYSYLPNILKRMDELEALGLNWNNRDIGVLSGSLDAYFRGLIISKLCNDTDFERKVSKMDVKFAQTGYEEWVPYYERLKERLKTVEPIYNL